MKTVISSKGQIVLPSQLRRQDAIAAGDAFRVERVGVGKYVLTREPRPSDRSLLEWLLACPVKGWFEPPKHEGSTRELIRKVELDVLGRHQRPQRSDAPRAGRARRRVARSK